MGPSKALLVMGLLVGLPQAPAAAESPVDYLPDRLEGVACAGKPELFVGRELYDYMDGGAELYLAYGFVDLAVQSYQKGDAQATIEVYRMGGPMDAFGIQAHSAKGEAVGVGVGAILSTGMLSFYKGGFYVRVVAKSTPNLAQELLLTLGKQVATKIPGSAKLPPEVSLLPKGARPGSLRYLTNPETGRTLWFDEEGEILLTEGARAFTAFYADGDAEVQATRATYPSRQAAKKACIALAKKLFLKVEEKGGECSASGKTPNEVFAALATREGVLRWSTGAADAKSAREWLGRIK